MAEKQQAVGSIWNVNSWHWEQKNYTSLAKTTLEEILLSISIVQDGITVTNSKIKSVDGEAQLNVRKGKQILFYEFNYEVEFKAENAEGDEAEGYYKIRDINPDDLDFEVEHITLNTKNEVGEAAKRIIAKRMKEELKPFVKDFPRRLAEYETNPEKIKQDEKQRLENIEATKRARIEKGQEKEQILQEEKKKEHQRKQQFSQWAEK